MSDGKQIDLMAIQADTPLGLVNEILLSGKFTSAPDDPVGEREDVIGEMTSFEKAILTAVQNIAESNNNTLEEAKAKGDEPDMAIILRNKHNFELMEMLLWASIQQRLNSYGDVGVGIRADYKIVSFKSLTPLEALLGGMMKGNPLAALAMRDEEKHDCEKCPDYEDCDLPFKTPRDGAAQQAQPEG